VGAQRSAKPRAKCSSSGRERLLLMHCDMTRLALAITLWLAATSTALAGSEKDPHAEHHHNHVIAGLKGVTVAEQARSHGHDLALTGYGACGFGEATLLDDRLAIEIGFVVTKAADEIAWATEPLLKVPLHVTEWFEPYAATGPVFVHVRDGVGQRFWLGGGQVVIGTYLWFAEKLGLDVDLSVGAAKGPDMSMVEMVFSMGPVLRD
jgi:hypothetical protein